MENNKMNFLVNNPIDYIGKPFDKIVIPVKTTELHPEDKIELQYKLQQIIKEYHIELSDMIVFD